MANFCKLSAGCISSQPASHFHVSQNTRARYYINTGTAHWGCSSPYWSGLKPGPARWPYKRPGQALNAARPHTLYYVTGMRCRTQLQNGTRRPVWSIVKWSWPLLACQLNCRLQFREATSFMISLSVFLSCWRINVFIIHPLTVIQRLGQTTVICLTSDEECST